METQTKKGIVTNATYKNSYDGNNGTVYYHTIEFDNGDKGSYGSKSQDQNKFVVGKETDYEWVKDDKGYIKIKPVQQGGGGGFRGAAPANPKAENARAALNTAALLIVGGKAPEDKQTGKPMSLNNLANNLFDWLQKKSS
jgi:hypothetical protein